MHFLLLRGIWWWRMYLTNVICHMPVVAPGAWVGGRARPWCYHEAQICPLVRSSIWTEFQNLFSRSLLPRSLPVTGSPDPVYTLTTGKEAAWKVYKKPKPKQTFSDSYMNTFLNSQKWLWYKMFAVLRSLNAQCTENKYFGCINHRIWEYYQCPLCRSLLTICAVENIVFISLLQIDLVHTFLTNELSKKNLIYFFRSRGCSAETVSSSSKLPEIKSRLFDSWPCLSHYAWALTP